MINKNVLIFALTVVLVAVGFVAGWNVARNSIQPQTETVRDTIVKVDTMNIVSPPDVITETELQTVYVPQTNIVVVNDSTYGVELLREQHHLSVPDTLDVWYSGIDAQVDSLKYYTHTTTIEVHDVAETPRQCFSLYGGLGADWFDGGYSYKVFIEAQVEMGKKFVVNAGGGLAVIEKTATPYVGVTLKYKLN